ncbi:DUF4344 domain-containing metallopeptidase [Nonomuraea sp. NBC_01738]|uniref:DUF4344 domain-containing metallopeptidase n=1 Tax=Nonomuraea sp. NBC_01738 TaxID=2976003 RepID=UPI002E0E1A48|nr:DUF4344 domain-containing metallopeptidase [Nonomuraea sp. NBC_01738]
MKFSKLVLGAGSLLAAAALTACGATAEPAPTKKAAAEKAAEPAATGTFVVTYEDATTEDNQAVQQLMQENKVLENVAEYATDLLKLDKDVPVIAKECGVMNAFWDPQTLSITMCYELTGHFNTLFTEAEYENATDQALAATNSVFFHELGHGAITLYDLPVTGKEEDAVDQLSALILTGAEQPDMVVTSADAWGLMSNTEELDEAAFADEHSLGAQRYYNLLCYVYGSDTKSYESLVTDEYLPQARAERCEDEYTKMSNAWSKLLQPHLKA